MREGDLARLKLGSDQHNTCEFSFSSYISGEFTSLCTSKRLRWQSDGILACKRHFQKEGLNLMELALDSSSSQCRCLLQIHKFSPNLCSLVEDDT